MGKAGSINEHDILGRGKIDKAHGTVAVVVDAHHDAHLPVSGLFHRQDTDQHKAFQVFAVFFPALPGTGADRQNSAKQQRNGRQQEGKTWHHGAAPDGCGWR